MQEELAELRWTETPRMRCQIVGSSVYFKRLFVSLAKYILGFALVFFLLSISNRQIWRDRGPQCVFLGATFGALYRLLIEVFPTSISVNSTRLYYNGAKKRLFVFSDCKSFSLTPVQNLIRVDFDGRRRRGKGLEHITIAAPQSAYEFLGPLAANGTLEFTANAENATGNLQKPPVTELSYASKPLNPFGGALFGMGFPLLFVGVGALAFPVINFLFFGLPRHRFLIALAISSPVGVIFAAIGVYFIYLGIPWIRAQENRRKQTRRVK
jgi:hypothetical protein